MIRFPGYWATSLLTGLSVSFAAPASADGSIGLDEVMQRIAKAPKLVADIQAELDRAGLKLDRVICSADRFGRNWPNLSGERSAPYECEIGKRKITIRADQMFLDKKGRRLGDLDKADPRRADHFLESSFQWSWEDLDSKPEPEQESRK